MNEVDYNGQADITKFTYNEQTDIADLQSMSEPLYYYGSHKDLDVFYISDIHIMHHLSYFDNNVDKAIDVLVRSLYNSFIHLLISAPGATKKVIVFAGDISSDKELTVAFMKRFMQIPAYQKYKIFKEELQSIDSIKRKYHEYDIKKIRKLEYDIIPYIDYEAEINPLPSTYDVRNYLQKKSNSEIYLPERVIRKVLQIYNYNSIFDKVDDLCEKYNVADIDDININLTNFKITHFVNTPVVFILGNHDYIGFFDVEEAVDYYKKHLTKYGVTVLQNEYIETDNYILFGGSGFAKYNNYDKHNANNLICCNRMMKSVCDDAREYEIKQTTLFENKYEEAKKLASAKNKCFICVSHYPVGSCFSHIDRETIYFSGHTHQNEYRKDQDMVWYANNQIGYHSNGGFAGEISFRVATTGTARNPFIELSDGFHVATPEQYIQFSEYINEPIGEGKLIKKRCLSGTMYVMKSLGYYGFFIVNQSGISIVSGAMTKKLTSSTNIPWIWENFNLVINKYLEALAPLRKIQMQISQELKTLGFYGSIHGLIVDIDFFNHIMINPYDGSVTFYYSPSFGLIKPFDSFEALLEFMLNQELENKSAFLSFGLLSFTEVRIQRYQKLCSTSSQLALRDIKSNHAVADDYVEVSRSRGAYGLSRTINSLQRLFTGHVLREFDLTLAETTNELVKKRKYSYIGRVFKDTYTNHDMIVTSDDLMDLITIVDTVTANSQKISLCAFKSRFTQKKAAWVTYSLPETETRYPELILKYIHTLSDEQIIN